jgi:hypothetical protein
VGSGFSITFLVFFFKLKKIKSKKTVIIFGQKVVFPVILSYKRYIPDLLALEGYK